MIRIVLDTNIVISSALGLEGNLAAIFKMLALGEIKNSTTLEIIEEIKDVLARPRIMKRMSLIESEFILSSYEEFSEKIKPGLIFDEVKDDPDDNKILGCAVASAADYIISGDNHLLNLEEFRGIKIVTPAEFVKIMNNSRRQNV